MISMATDQATDLESALLARADALANEYRTSAQHRREEILAESAEHLKLREEQQLLAAKDAADRLQRQQVQAAEIRLQGEQDRVRWTLVQSVLTQLDEAAAKLANDDAKYLPILSEFIKAGAAAIDNATVVVELNARDLGRVGGRWDEFSRDLAPGKALQLAHEARDCSGGALLRDPEDRVRVDHTFEGRKQRLTEELTRTVMERLFGIANHG
jgi:V/A-type H+-transporting ATPase subunit E